MKISRVVVKLIHYNEHVGQFFKTLKGLSQDNHKYDYNANYISIHTNRL